MSALINLLKQLEADDTISYTQYLTDGEEDSLPTLIQDIITLACGNLITNKGGCNWTNINWLKGEGFNVTTGEQDSFGWLSGCIHTSKGTIVYG